MRNYGIIKIKKEICEYMKYCLSSRCSHKYLAQVDEIKVQWRDRESIIDLANEYQSAIIILVCEPEANQEIEKIDM